MSPKYMQPIVDYTIQSNGTLSDQKIKGLPQTLKTISKISQVCFIW